ncbi:hypothetical protein BAUCODRAFT_82793, partial [Baudoinia panamericana UAMH 10762]
MTQRMEESMRKMIDGKYGVEQIKDSLNEAMSEARANANTQASTQQLPSQRRSRRIAGSDDEGDNHEDEEYPEITPTDPTSGTQRPSAPSESFRNKLEDAKTRYQSHSLYNRYAENNDYVDFKRLVHDAQQGGDDKVPVPEKRTWFQEFEAPPPGVTTHAQDEEEDDDDIAISRATISTKCPLTLQEFRDPLTSRKCNHSFEASAITELLRGKQSVQCPCGGCQQMLARDDLHRDKVLTRKIKRLQHAKQLEEED